MSQFAEYNALESGERAKYALEGGGYPIFVKGVEGVMGAIVIAGLDGDQAHQVLVKALDEYRELRNDFRSPVQRATSTTIKKYEP